MAPPLSLLPELPAWAQQLANILPLTVLVEFIDFSLKLHIFELNGLVPLWSWPVTPEGAHLILSKDSSAACCLDQPIRCGTALQCIDGRYGDFYPCSAPTTVRLCVAALPVDQVIPNNSQRMESRRPRIQRLDFIHVSLAPGTTKTPQDYLRIFRHASLRYLVVSMTGWLLWLATVVFCFHEGIYVAAAYLMLMPMVGFMALLTRGGKPRELESLPCRYPRMIVAADSMNATDWMGFYGGSELVNSLLNRPMYRESRLGLLWRTRWLIRSLILGQWVLALASCTQQDWNALAISFWMFWCAVASEYAFRPVDSVKDWLKYTCRIKVRRINARFSSRRAMLGALVYLNPDTAENRLRWMNPILEDGPDRREWERALLEVIRIGRCEDQDIKKKYWWGWIQESVEMGRKIEIALKHGIVQSVEKVMTSSKV